MQKTVSVLLNACSGQERWFFTINAHGDGWAPPPGMKIDLKTLPTADCPLPTIFTTKKGVFLFKKTPF